jgi:hypothetical protein
MIDDIFMSVSKGFDQTCDDYLLFIVCHLQYFSTVIKNIALMLTYYSD